MQKTWCAMLALVTVMTPAIGQGNSTDPLSVSSASSLAGAFARTSTTSEEELQRAVAYVDRVCSSHRRRAQRECARVWAIIDAARTESQVRQTANRQR